MPRLPAAGRLPARNQAHGRTRRHGEARGCPDRRITRSFRRGWKWDLPADACEVGSIEVAGGLVAPQQQSGFRAFLGVRGTMQASGYLRGALISMFGQFVNVAAPVRLQNVLILNRGGIFVGVNGSILDDGAGVLRTSGSYTSLAAPGSNRPTIANFEGVQIEGGRVGVGYSTYLISKAGVVAAGAGNIVAAGGGNIVAAGAGNLIGADGASLVGPDGASLIGADGASIVAAGAGNIVAAGAGNLIGADGGSLVGPDGATIARNAASKSADAGTARAAASDFRGISLEGGTVGGNLTMRGDVLNRGAFVAPGSSAGTIHVTGSYTQEANGTLVLEVDGTQARQFDQLQIDGTASLGGKLIVKSIDGFTPQSGDTFAPLTYSAVNGQFDSVTSNAQLSFGANGATMHVSGPNPPAAKALNISTRMRVETGDNVLIGGFIVTGTSPKKSTDSRDRAVAASERRIG